MQKEYRPLLWLGLIAVAAYVAERYRSLSQGLTLNEDAMTPEQAFIAKLLPIAKQVELETGISARCGVVQAALESGNGLSGLTSSPTLTILPSGVKGAANNLFGFKTGQAWLTAQRPHVMLPTKDYYNIGQRMPNGVIATSNGQALTWPAPFRAYPDWEASYRDWARLMQTPNYVADGALLALKNDDLQALGDALSIHYAPNQDYAGKLASREQSLGAIV